MKTYKICDCPDDKCTFSECLIAKQYGDKKPEDCLVYDDGKCAYKEELYVMPEVNNATSR
jgi:hypothetical protein